ncbi:MAG: exonuclease domain-containing protein [Solirubrobacterales bacterium]
MSWHQGRMAAFDIESTGVDPTSDRIVTATVSVVGPGFEPDSASWLADPGIEIPDGATRVHGITTEHARANGRPAAEVVEEITAKLATAAAQGVPIVAFNARYDLTMLDREARRHGLEPLTDRVGDLLVIDPLVIDKQIDRFRKGKRTLTDVCALYRVPLEDAHAADADAIAAARVAWRMAGKFPDELGIELEQLHAQQIGWAAEQAASLQEYFQAQGRDEFVEGAWPVIPAEIHAERLQGAPAAA